MGFTNLMEMANRGVGKSSMLMARFTTSIVAAAILATDLWHSFVCPLALGYNFHPHLQGGVCTYLGFV